MPKQLRQTSPIKPVYGLIGPLTSRNEKPINKQICAGDLGEDFD